MNREPILILADPKGKAYTFARKVYEKLNANEHRERKFQFVEVEISKFNDGEIFSKILKSVREKDCYFIHDSSMPPQDWAFSLMQINEALNRSQAKRVIDVLPYMKYSRQDRLTEARTPISASIIARMINKSVNGVITTDLHNPAIHLAYNEKIAFENLKGYKTISTYIKEKYPEFLENAVIVAPDAGSTKMAASYAKRLGLGLVVADKERKKAGEVGDMIIIGEVKNKNALIPDDMIDTGGTLIKAAETLKEKGANKIYACATHGLFSKGIKALNNSPLEKIIVTDSIPQKSKGKIEIVTLTDLFAETIFRISHGYSVSELFD